MAVISSSALLGQVLASKARTASLALSATAAYLFVLVIYRLFLSPLAKIPGPKLAAATGWYEAYFQFIKRGGGQYTFKTNELHDIYGPIVRITPHEVHVRDPEFFETIYAPSGIIDKTDSARYQFVMPGGLFASVESELHRLRRAPITAYFSKTKIAQQTPNIQERVNFAMGRLESEYLSTHKVLNMVNLASCFATDVIIRYAFGTPSNVLSEPDFQNPSLAATKQFRNLAHVFMQFPWIPRVMSKVPDTWLAVIAPSTRPISNLLQMIRNQIIAVKQRKAEGKKIGDDSIFGALHNSNLPPKELEVSRLADEAGSLVAAASDTTAWTISVTLFHIVSNPVICDRLRQELDMNMPDPSALPPLEVLNRMSYLNACVEEGLRLAYGEMTRSPRIHRTKAVTYQNFVLPPGTRISSDAWSMHNDESVFPEHQAYRPERFLGDSRSTTGKRLSRYQVAFSRGSRMCLGMQLAYAEVGYFVGALLRRFEVELFETDRTDVDPVRDELVVGVRRSSKGIRFKVVARRS